MVIGVGFASVPSEDDQVTEEHGTKVFLAPEVAAVPSEAVLDVRDTDDGRRLVITHPD